MKTFKMYREADESGVSGTGLVLEGMIFSDGTTVIRWCVKGMINSTGVYESYESFSQIHIESHPTNKTRLEFFEATKMGIR